MSEIPKVNRIEAPGDRPANPYNRESRKKSDKIVADKGEYYNPIDIVEISEEAKEKAETEIDPE